jgi:PhoU domain-containing protein
VESVIYQDVELAGMAVADAETIERRCREIQQGILTLLARQAPVAGDLRIVAALLHTTRCIERMGNQCVNIATLVPAPRRPERSRCQPSALRRPERSLSLAPVGARATSAPGVGRGSIRTWPDGFQ